MARHQLVLRSVRLTQLRSIQKEVMILVTLELRPTKFIRYSVEIRGLVVQLKEEILFLQVPHWRTDDEAVTLPMYLPLALIVQTKLSLHLL